MADLLESAVTLSLADAIIMLQRQLAEIRENPSVALEELQGKKVLRLETPLADRKADPLAFLQSCASKQKFYWRDREDNTETAAVGVAEKLSPGSDNDFDSLFMAVQSRLAGMDESVRFWGGFRFDTERSQIDTCWQSFGRGQLVLPRIELHRSDDTCHLACNILAEEISGLSEAEVTHWFGYNDSDIASHSLQLAENRQRTDLPTRAEWESNVAATTDLISRGQLDKLVLSRKSTIRMRSPVDKWEILRFLRQNSTDCFLFGISPSDEATFVGATPEQLYYRNELRVCSEAIAGTRARGKNSEHDEQLASELLDSEKDGREHQLVVSGIDKSLRPLCDNLSVSTESTLLKLSRVQHLLTRFEGNIRSGIKDADILDALHPTPAVGGFPRENAIEKMNQFEPFDRGWYAGPVGYVSSSSARFAVAIRCALVTADSLSMFSGAGLVAGSDPSAEWREIEDKISNFLTVIGL